MFKTLLLEIVKIAEQGALTFTIDVEGTTIVAKDLEGQELANFIISQVKNAKNAQLVLDMLNKKKAKAEKIETIESNEEKPIKKQTKKD